MDLKLVTSSDYSEGVIIGDQFRAYHKTKPECFAYIAKMNAFWF